ncbi:MAG TPA: RNA polymerase sigma-54 factor [Devosia sp.]|nr:RNA polymerase sigma-54 factor [Devosia sp.]
MALTPRLEIRQSQSLALTPQLMQSIKLLQFSHLEVAQFVEEQLLGNPLLERDESGEDGSGTRRPQEQVRTTEAPQPDARIELGEPGEGLQSASRIADAMDTEQANLFPEQVGQDSIRASTQLPTERQRHSAGEIADIEQYVPARVTLADHLAEQIGVLLSEPVDRLIARNLVDNLDDTGYLATTCGAVAEQLGACEEDVEKVLLRLQTCDPAGVFARDVRECLALQLREKDRLDPLMAALLDNLELVASHDLGAIRQAIGVSSDDLKDMLEEIRTLDPRPGRAFDGAPVQPVIADVFVHQDNEGGWSVELNTDVLPKVLVNRTYYAQVSKLTRDREEKTFLVDCLQSANWLTKSLDQRAQTILKTATEIVRMQDAFLIHGVSHLKPMTLKMVADAIEMHESTISRVTTAKYISTPRGLFEMKYFFTTALGSLSGENQHSAETVRYQIKRMIDAESPQSVLSDDAIADRLRKSAGIDVARRTVAKYREGMHIPSSVVRRRQKKARFAQS